LLELSDEDEQENCDEETKELEKPSVKSGPTSAPEETIQPSTALANNVKDKTAEAQNKVKNEPPKNQPQSATKEKGKTPGSKGENGGSQ